MRLSRYVLLGTVSALALAAAPASAQQFSCGKTGGNLVFAQEAKVNSLDQHTSSTISTRNVAMNMFESLVTRDENMNPIPELAQEIIEAPDGMMYTFKLRQGVKFHNGKPMTSDDVMATFDRYKKVGIDRGILDVVDKWEAPDPATFVLKMKQAQPTFIENLSSFSVPVVIVPRENASAEAMQLKPVGTGPWEYVEFVADSHVKLKRYEGYQADKRFPTTNGFGGYKVACVDTVNLRIVTEAGARVAGLETGEFHGVEDIPAKAQARLKDNKNIVLKPLKNFWVQIATPNLSFPPTDNLKFRQAVQAALDMDDIMEASSDGYYKLGHALQFSGSPYYTDAGKEHYNQKNVAKAKQLLAESGYKGEKLILLTNKDYTSMYNGSLVMAEQLKAVGINAELLIHDWPAALDKSQKENTGWNYFFTGWTSVIGQGGLPSLRNLTDPNNVHKPKDNKSDTVLMENWNAGLRAKTLEERKGFFAKSQQRIFDQALALPFGLIPKVAAVRSNVDGFQNFFTIRAWNVSIKK